MLKLKSNIKYFCVAILFLLATVGYAQSADAILGFEEYLGYVKKYHPIARQAQLTLSVGQANLLKARGGFDPKIQVDYAKKEFKDTEYWDRLNAAFKVPTYFGLEFKAGYENYEGTYINPDETVPEDGLYSAGVTMDVLQGFWANERMATLRKAKFFREQSKADQDILVNQVLYDASLAYFNWLKAYEQAQVYREFIESARLRLEGVKKSALAGDKAIIDTVEARITYQNRRLGLEQANLNFTKARLALSNYLWIENVPVEVQETAIPEEEISQSLDVALDLLGKTKDSFAIENHPKYRSLDFKVKGLLVDKRLKGNKLLPKLTLEYNFLTTAVQDFEMLNTQDYKGGLNFSFPLFLRKERGDLKLAKLKLQDAEFNRDFALVSIQNKVEAIYAELDSYQNQVTMIDTIVLDYRTLLNAEERKFGFGESSLFLVNSREGKLIDAQLKQIEMWNKYYTAKADLFKSLAINPINP
ncbi:TolC family protein [Flavobacterium sp. ASW18X]|uniref:TolC family protein n=1 Tax=Flavobacterium sp. ASW18X TaxID=2572595 RepID=UPI0010AE6FD0|nr:TolC family protein [Flavobacterium sp. ASW18X]TKD65386.1 TolC family protein [Flavobacterium sp. ASW18X]